MLHSIVNMDQLGTVINILSFTDNKDLAKLYISTLALIDNTLMLVLKEMFSARKHILYWAELAKSSNWELSVYKLNSIIFQKLFIKQSDALTILDSRDVMLHHADVLRSDLNELSIFLEQVNQSAGLLKNIYIELINLGNITKLILNDNEKQYVRNMAHIHIKKSLLLLNAVYNVYLPHLLVTTEDYTPISKSTDLSINGLNLLLVSLEYFIDKITIRNKRKTFPLEYTTFHVHKPSRFERNWFRNLLFGIVSIFTIHKVHELWKDGTVTKLYQLIQNKVHDHIIDPVSDLGRELFDTIRKREYVVTREDLEQSRTALHRMLDDFSKSKQGYSLILSDMQERIQNTAAAAAATGKKIIANNINDITSPGISSSSSGLSSSSSSETKQHPVHTATNTTNIDMNSIPSSSLFATPEQAMDALMSEYEKELQTPVKGILFGSLMTAMLIQMQKLKVHTEAAMLTMDQILASNELTMAGMAAMPAIGFMAWVIYSVRNILRPLSSSKKNGTGTMHFRLIMSDVERSLQEVNDLTLKRNNIKNRNKELIEFNSRAYLNDITLTSKISSRNDVLCIEEVENEHSLDDLFNYTTKTTSSTTTTAINNNNNNNNNTIIDNNSTVSNNINNEKLLTRRLQIARGILCFNLVRLRSEFHHLFLGFLGYGDSTSTTTAINIKQINSGSATSSVSSYTSSSTSRQLRHGIMGAMMRKVRIQRQSSLARSNSLTNSSYYISTTTTSIPPTSTSATNNNSTPISLNIKNKSFFMKIYENLLNYLKNDNFNDIYIPSYVSSLNNNTTNYTNIDNIDSNNNNESSEDDTALVMLSAMLQHHQDQSIFSYSSNFFKAIYMLIFGRNEILTSTTQASSLNRDIALLESPDNEISLDRKIITANRMRLSYNCLLPVK